MAVRLGRLEYLLHEFLNTPGVLSDRPMCPNISALQLTASGLLHAITAPHTKGLSLARVRRSRDMQRGNTCSLAAVLHRKYGLRSFSIPPDVRVLRSPQPSHDLPPVLMEGIDTTPRHYLESTITAVPFLLEGSAGSIRRERRQTSSTFAGF